ncbi:hypothetical protein E4631_12045 [Hymenobacter sp. UV11]|uniref:hypothetical protein n=1 Tax=Hymenobacter sp. UV11 TaxID=1849735 RepID=UPI00106181AA|nr:hypothetical protein [Hymenobacter sp. UV11]TFZ65834.1 hypothetical protein E4631_12045 [Hymenobacter sp. UV11]
MDDKHKAAYRSIVYQFLLDIRNVPLPLTDDEQAVRIGRFVGPVAYQLHNLALASVNDFTAFDETAFWAGINEFNQRNPNMQLSHYRKTFELALFMS